MQEIADQVEELAAAEWEKPMPGPAWSWWLSRATADGRGIRRWSLWIWYTRQQGTRNKASAALRFLRGYVEAPHEVSVALRRFGDKTQRVHGVSRATQFRQLLMLRWRFGIRPESYYKFQLFKPERLTAAPNFLEETGQLLQVVHRHASRTADERLF